MAEGQFAISIPVDLDLAGARAELRRFLEEAAKGVAVPVRGGRDPGGQGAASFPTVAAAEQAAVQRAMDQAQARTPGYGAAFPTAMGGAPGGGNIRTGVDTGDAQIAFRRIRGIFDEVKRHIEGNPIRVTVDTTGATGPLGAARAGVGGASGSAALAVAQATGISAGLPSQSVADLRTSLFASSQARVDALSQAVPGGVIPGTAVGPRGAGYAYGIPRSAADTPLGGIRYARAVAGALAVTEISGAVQAYRTGQSQSLLAETPEDARLARSQAKDRMFSGLIGGAISFFPNLLNTPGAPQRELIEANEMVAYRRMRDEARQKTAGVYEGQAYRQAYAAGGPRVGERAAIESRANTQLEVLEVQRRDYQNRLDQRTPVVRQSFSPRAGAPYMNTVTGGDPVVTGELRETIQESLNANWREHAGIVAQRKFDTDQLDRANRLARNQVQRRFRGGSRGGSLTAAAEGRPREAAEREFLEQLEDAEEAVDNDPVSLRDQRRTSILKIGGRMQEIATERFETRTSLDAQIRQSRFRQAGSRYGVESITDPIVTAANRDARQFEREEEPELAVKRRTLGVQQLREARADYFRSIRFEEVSGGRIAAGSGSPFAGVERKFSDAEDQIGKAGGKASVGTELDNEKVPGLLSRLLTVMEQVRDRHFKAKAG